MALHGILLAVAVVVPLIPGCRPKELAIPLDFTVVLGENLVGANVPDEPSPTPTRNQQRAAKRRHCPETAGTVARAQGRGGGRKPDAEETREEAGPAQKPEKNRPHPPPPKNLTFEGAAVETPKPNAAGEDLYKIRSGKPASTSR